MGRSKELFVEPGSQHIQREEEGHSPAFCLGLVQKALKQVKAEAHAYI